MQLSTPPPAGTKSTALQFDLFCVDSDGGRLAVRPEPPCSSRHGRGVPPERLALNRDGPLANPEEPALQAGGTPQAPCTNLGSAALQLTRFFA